MATTSDDTVEIQIPRDLFEELRELASKVDYQSEELTVLLLRTLLETLREEGRSLATTEGYPTKSSGASWIATTKRCGSSPARCSTSLSL